MTARARALLAVLAGAVLVGGIAAVALLGDGDDPAADGARGDATGAPPSAASPPESARETGPSPATGADDLLGDLMDSLGGGVPGAACLLPDGGAMPGIAGGAEPAPAEPSALVDHIAAEVAALRELAFSAPVEATFLDPEEVAVRIEELLAEDYGPEQIDTDQRLLAALGAIPRGADLGEVVSELLGAQVAGFYVPSSDELVVRSSGGSALGPADRITLAHELDHALTDQVLGLPDDTDTGDPDADLALLAVIEGDASLLMNQWALRNLSFADQLSLLGDPAVLASQASLEDAPHYLAEELAFPYLDGLDFTCEVWRRGGWDAVDALYGQPPASSAQVLFPERFFAGEEPVDPPRLGPPAGYAERTTESFGAAPLSWLLAAPGGDPGVALSDPEGRAAAWAGGAATVWAEGDRTAVGLSLVDGGGGTAALCDSVTAWYAAAFPDSAQDDADPGSETFDGDAQDAVVVCEGDHVAVGIGPDLATATTVVAG